MLKQIFKVTIFICIFLFTFARWNAVLIPKDRNYMVREMLKEQDEEFDVLVFGSCHAYTSFNPIEFYQSSGLTSYNLARPSEIIPATYLQMYEAFKTQKPKVVFIESWGIQAYDTYIDTNAIFDSYLVASIDCLPYSDEKLEVIKTFDTLDERYENIPISRYKSRLYEQELNNADFFYEFERNLANQDQWLAIEMKSRESNKGFLANIGHIADVALYNEMQVDIYHDEMSEINGDLLYYVDKIIALCDENNIIPIFYRTPYVCKETEIERFNYLEAYLNAKNVVYIDLEKAIDFDYENDMYDFAHLNYLGAAKATNYLTDYLLEHDYFSEEELHKTLFNWESLSTQTIDLFEP